MPAKRQVSHRAMLDHLLRSDKLSAGQTIAFKKLHEGLASGAISALSEHEGLWVEHIYNEHKSSRTVSPTNAKLDMTSTPEIPAAVRGWWRIVESEMWAADALDLLGPALISFTGHGDRLRMIAILAHVNCKPTKTGVSFTWEGADEYDPVSGTGTAKLGKDGRLRGTIKIKSGDRSTFVAERTGEPDEPIAEPPSYRDKWRRRR